MSFATLFLRGFVVLDGSLCSAEADQDGAQSRVAGAGVAFGFLAFTLTAAQFLAQRFQLVHTAQCALGAYAKGSQ
jgi:hypothetical protein